MRPTAVSVAIWVAVACVSLHASPQPAGAAAETAPSSKPAATTQPVSQSPWLKNSGYTGGQDDDQPTGLRRMLAYVAVIAVLAVGGVIIFKKVLPRFGVTTPSGRRVSVIETTYIAPRKSVHLLAVGKRKILLGSGREGVSMLADVTDALEPAAGDQSND